MSNDLISRGAALKIVFGNGKFNLNSSDVYRKIEDLPTAYDVDAVCKKIKNVPHGYLNIETEQEIIDIVRNGGK